MKKADLMSRLDEWIIELRYQEKAQSTLNQYRANTMKFIDWLDEDEEITKDTTIRYKVYLGEIAGSTSSINTWIVTINKYLRWLGSPELTIKKVKTQTKQSNEEVLSVADYKRLLRFAKRENKHQLYYIMRILAMTGIRVSELQYFKVENLRTVGNIVLALIRIVLFVFARHGQMQAPAAEELEAAGGKANKENYKKLMEYKKLLEQGVLTEAEYEDLVKKMAE